MVPTLEITPLCNSCDNCRLICPENAIIKVKDHYAIESWACTLCNICVEICPKNCIKLKKNLDDDDDS
ncbi:MAG: 4Fe-4S dicluster domain-containing protein [Bacteriovoracaceae bacterium]|nr:4Fe-4S dicluster domain-containing protein [Bacteriovoracaceae bacterium]